MKIIEIRNTTIGEVAYVYDEKRGKIIKVLVEDHTGYDLGAGEDDAVETYFEENKPPIRKVRRAPPRREVDLEEEEPAGDPDLAKMTRPRTIVPPGMAGVFIDKDLPGAAVERRRVGA